jgi:class 3 adenylate cyclase
MAQLPSGTVTFLFTDIEGSTRLLQRVGRERYADLRAQRPYCPERTGVRNTCC